MSMANVGTPCRTGLAHARRRFDIVLEVEDALGALVPEHPHAVETGGVVAVAVAEQQIHTGNLGLFSDSLGDHVHDRNRFQVREIPDREALAAAGLRRRRLGHRRLVRSRRRRTRPERLAQSFRPRRHHWLAPLTPPDPTRRESATPTRSIVGITTNSADTLRLIIHFPLT